MLDDPHVQLTHTNGSSGRHGHLSNEQPHDPICTENEHPNKSSLPSIQAVLERHQTRALKIMTPTCRP